MWCRGDVKPLLFPAPVSSGFQDSLAAFPGTAVAAILCPCSLSWLIYGAAQHGRKADAFLSSFELAP